MISEVGYLHDNPEIEALLLRKGIQPINEDELLQIIDVSLSSQLTIPHCYDGNAAAHIPGRLGAAPSHIISVDSDPRRENPPHP